ncbi:MAG: hypothetical protein S4CHLAM81_14830 [Chlamydiales bacterium]|nr:hypothetical protein [Chlamydiales bacterium]MCH9636252.1 hypothetical protein [Chlamydiales bacterium]MCH9703304.1 DUF5398 domain-containing protein [Chlamydiota bacterium]
MFGMESGKQKKKMADFVFDLEADLKDPGKQRAVKEQVEARIAQLKNMLRSGGEQKEFDQVQALLHGYLAIQKVMQRVNRKTV